jgi:hypothetical protein
MRMSILNKKSPYIIGWLLTSILGVFAGIFAHSNSAISFLNFVCWPFMQFLYNGEVLSFANFCIAIIINSVQFIALYFLVKFIKTYIKSE